MISKCATKLLCLTLSFFLNVWLPISQASSFNVSPIYVYFNKEQKIVTLTITNQALVPLTEHLKAKKWQQRNGQDVYSDTPDLIMAPPIVTIEGNSSQVIRLALRGTRHNHDETAYRLYISEIPTLETATSVKFGAQMTLNMSLPVFVQPSNDIPLATDFQAFCNQGQLWIKNVGRRSGRLKSFNIPGVTPKPVEILRYILPHQAISIPVSRPNVTQGRRLIANINDQQRTFDVLEESQDSQNSALIGRPDDASATDPSQP